MAEDFWIKVVDDDGNCKLSFRNVHIVLDECDIDYLIRELISFQYCHNVRYEIA